MVGDTSASPRPDHKRRTAASRQRPEKIFHKLPRFSLAAINPNIGNSSNSGWSREEKDKEEVGGMARTFRAGAPESLAPTFSGTLRSKETGWGGSLVSNQTSTIVLTFHLCLMSLLGNALETSPISGSQVRTFCCTAEPDWSLIQSATTSCGLWRTGMRIIIFYCWTWACALPQEAESDSTRWMQPQIGLKPLILPADHMRSDPAADHRSGLVIAPEANRLQTWGVTKTFFFLFKVAAQALQPHDEAHSESPLMRFWTQPNRRVTSGSVRSARGGAGVNTGGT